ncbi:MAG: DUF1826 domain-containing protein [Alphaproteobacteria bacterium]|nr:DUF1826 domain-containing protein [Alphaproteobacteria bacterium]
MTPDGLTIDNPGCREVRIVHAPRNLRMIHDTDVEAVMWRRTPLPGFQTWIDRLAPRSLPSARAIFRPAEVSDVLVAACEASKTPVDAERNRLIDDAAALVTMFAQLMGAPYLRLRFDVIDTDACCKFHVDSVPARLICTYRGRGTQYGVARAGQEPEHVLNAPTGSPMIFRGNQWGGKSRPRLMHRSPPIGGTGETRLVLVIDPIQQPANEV